jgi:hypothetical protein
MRPAKPTAARLSSARSLVDFPPIIPGSETFSSAVSSGRRKYPWKMKPIFRFRNRACEEDVPL